jgi:hypothetical protein
MQPRTFPRRLRSAFMWASGLDGIVDDLRGRCGGVYLILARRIRARDFLEMLLSLRRIRRQRSQASHQFRQVNVVPGSPACAGLKFCGALIAGPRGPRRLRRAGRGQGIRNRNVYLHLSSSSLRGTLFPLCAVSTIPASIVELSCVRVTLAPWRTGRNIARMAWGHIVYLNFHEA